MGDVLRLRKVQAVRRLRRLGDELFTRQHVHYSFAPQGSIYIAGTMNDDTGHATFVTIGTRQIESKVFNSKIPDKVFTRVVLNMYHEYKHCVQKNYTFRQKTMDDYTAKQLMQEVACHGNPSYYMDNGNYCINANEIQAEQYGILHAYEYLCEEFPDIDPSYHESVLVEIVNDNILNTLYFVQCDTPFTSLQQIEKAFDDAYDASFMTKRTYFVNRDVDRDEAKQYMRDHPDAKDVYLSLSDPEKQDRCIAAINCEIHPAYVTTYLTLSDMNLSYESLIDHPHHISKNQKDTTSLDRIIADFPQDSSYDMEDDYG